MTDQPPSAMPAQRPQPDAAPLIALASGGTGGHLFPAFALAEELEARGSRSILLTDERGLAFGQNYRQVERHLIPSMGLFRTSRLQQIKGLLAMARGYFKARRLLKTLRPGAVVGFGGYASAPSMLAAQHLGIPTLIHEQNSVFGRANRFLARKARLVCTSFAPTFGLEGLPASRLKHVSNPVRQVFAQVADYQPASPQHRFCILIYGGSQGARYFSDFMPQVMEALSPSERQRFRLIQQARPEDVDALRTSYEALGVEAQIASFFDDMAAVYGQAHLVICRSGASSVAEIATVGRPAAFVPLPTAVDDQQTLNARALVDHGAAWLWPQSENAPAQRAQELRHLLTEPLTLTQVAAKARAQSHARAARNLADALFVTIQAQATAPT